jgi:hypothetical protein
MADAIQGNVIPGAQQEFWRPPVAGAEATLAAGSSMAEACSGCGSEYLIGARFCHTCGISRAILAQPVVTETTPVGFGHSSLSRIWVAAAWVGSAWRRIRFPAWMRYLHFHEIKSWVGLPTASLIAFLAGLGCVAGALGVSFFYRASNLAEFQAIQLWRIEWLLAATAAFVAGILLKKPSGGE